MANVVAVYIHGTAVFHCIFAKAAAVDVHFALLTLQISNAAVFTVRVADIAAVNVKIAFSNLNAAAVARSVGSALKCALFVAAAANDKACARAVYDYVRGAAACEGAAFFVKAEVEGLVSADGDVVFKGYSRIFGNVEVRRAIFIVDFAAVPCGISHSTVACVVFTLSAADAVGVTRQNGEILVRGSVHIGLFCEICCGRNMLARRYSGNFAGKAAVRRKSDSGPACKVVDVDLHRAFGDGLAVNVYNSAGNDDLFAVHNRGNIVYGDNRRCFVNNAVHADFLVLIYVRNGVNAVHRGELNAVAEDFVVGGFYVTFRFLDAEADAPARLDRVVRRAVVVRQNRAGGLCDVKIGDSHTRKSVSKGHGIGGFAVVPYELGVMGVCGINAVCVYIPFFFSRQQIAVFVILVPSAELIARRGNCGKKYSLSHRKQLSEIRAVLNYLLSLSVFVRYRVLHTNKSRENVFLKLVTVAAHMDVMLFSFDKEFCFRLGAFMRFISGILNRRLVAAADYTGKLYPEAAVALQRGLNLARLIVYQKLKGSGSYGFASFVLDRAGNNHVIPILHGFGDFIYGNGSPHNFGKSGYHNAHAFIYI